MCMIEYRYLNLQPDLKGVRIVSLLEDTKPKTYMKALRSKKKVGLCFGVEYDWMSCVFLSIRT